MRSHHATGASTSRRFRNAPPSCAFVVAVNCFAGARRHDARDVCRALDLDPGTPVALCDARERDSGKEVLIQLVEHAGRMHTARLLDSVG